MKYRLWCIAVLGIIFADSAPAEEASSSSSSSSSSYDVSDDKNDCEATNKPTVHSLIHDYSNDDVIHILGTVYEHSPWVAQEFVASTDKNKTNITTVTQLADALKAIVNQAPYERQLALLRAHPDLRDKAAAETTTTTTTTELTADSQKEQAAAGLSTLTAAELDEFHALNQAYRQKFSFPFILAVRNASKQTILAALAGRLPNVVQDEFGQALRQVHKIAWMRLLDKLDWPSTAAGFLTCHVLDTANGTPAANMRITLHRLSPNPTLIGEYVTNTDGRLSTGAALRGGYEMIPGVYEWTFFVGDYFAAVGTATAGQPFLNQVPLRFGMDNPDDHYHVPLLVSPWSYSTYRGS